MGDTDPGRVRARYIDARPARGKTFMIRALLFALRSPSPGRALIVVTTAWTGVAASQYLGGFSAPETDGTTSHRRFRITARASWDSDDPPACQVTGGVGRRGFSAGDRRQRLGRAGERPSSGRQGSRCGPPGVARVRPPVRRRELHRGW
ncbi:unnamed protein product [Laminaria digitata]